VTRRRARNLGLTIAADQKEIAAREKRVRDVDEEENKAVWVVGVGGGGTRMGNGVVFGL
jgi:hypothetical protein